ncbi:glycosyltransferase family 2 protein [Fusobacterium polymorphum]|uniref:glycosyltransferase family 2 protein n=1 Tax=Fusobacterium nucleatum subsp. polymorphum TaxID=76857 RepID=UPI003008D4B1
MIKNLEQNYISVIIVVNDEKKNIIEKINKINDILKNNFKNSEILIVDNTSKKISFESLKNLKINHTIIKLPIKHGNQSALNAGIAMAIGDYIVEIEDISFDIDYNQIVDLYKKSQEGNDFVFLTPKQSRWSSKIFYKILNRAFRNMFESDINSSVMTLSSRRGQNKIVEVGKRIINRNVAYVLSGLKSSSIFIDIKYRNKRNFSSNLMLMFDTLIYYTDVVMLFSQQLSFIFFILFGLGAVYSIVQKLFFDIVKGWASIFTLTSLGFFGIFFILSIIIRYLHHILRNSLNSKDYIFGSIEKNN